MNDKCVYTINFGDYDRLREPAIITPGWDYICYSNREISSKNWEVRIIEPNLSHCLSARYVYINSHLFAPEYKHSLMIGGQVEILCDLDQFVEQHCDLDRDVSLMTHPARSCIYKEADLILKEGIDKSGRVEKQIARYKREGFPANYGLYAHGIILRENNQRVGRHNELWWKEVLLGSHRDQLSFMFTLWKYGLVTCHSFPYSVLYGKEFGIYFHGKDKRVFG